MEEKPEEPYVSATEWRHMYFAGISKRPIQEINLTEVQMSGLLSLIGFKAVISNGAAIEPQYLINSKGATPWVAMYAFVLINDPEALTLIANGKLRAHVPPDFIRGAFGAHINWPRKIIEKYDLVIGEYHLFAIPFLVHNSVNQMGGLNQSMKAPDGSLEIFGVYEFNESNPEGSLKELSELASFIKENRANAIQ